LTADSTVNAPNAPGDTDDWGVFVWIWRYGSTRAHSLIAFTAYSLIAFTAYSLIAFAPTA
jgi:hypothetical protein